MKLNESFENNDDQPNIDPEFLLLKERIKNFTERTLEELADLDPEKLKIVKAILNEKQLKKMNSYLNDRYDELSDLSEKLIDSDTANTPETKKKRAEIARELNEIIEIQKKLEELLVSAEESRLIFSITDKKDVDEAEEIVDQILNDFNNSIKPKTDLN